jgi:hypothetical protein
MMCCGRSSGPVTSTIATVAPTTPRSAASVIPRPGSSGARGDVILQHRYRGRVLVRGPATGRPYVFSAEQATQRVDFRDAEGLLRTGHFIRG